MCKIIDEKGETVEEGFETDALAEAYRKQIDKDDAYDIEDMSPLEVDEKRRKEDPSYNAYCREQMNLENMHMGKI
jgi:hypothetical protein